MIQSSYSDAPEIGVEGMLSDNHENTDVVSGMCSSRKLISVAIVAANGGVYTITLNGTPFVFTADGDATTAEIGAGLVALIEAGSEPVKATGTSTPILLESELDGDEGDFTYSDAATAGSLTETVLVAQNQGVAFGRFVCLDERAVLDVGAVDFPIRLPRQATDITGGRALGFAIQDRAREAGAFEGTTMVPVARKARMYVRPEVAVVKGDPIYVRFSGSALGRVRNTDDSATCALLPDGEFLTTTAAEGLAIIEFDC